MKIEFIENTAVIESETGLITKIAAPEDIDVDITQLLHRDFTFDVEGFGEHYYAYAINHEEPDVIDAVVHFFKTQKASI